MRDSRHDTWADGQATRYRGVADQKFSFWDDLKSALDQYCSALNVTAGRDILVFGPDETTAIVVHGPLIDLEIRLDSVSQALYYSFSSEALAKLWKAITVPAIHGTITVDRQSFYGHLECKPPLILRHLNQDLDLNAIPDERKHNWPVSDILARCLIEKVLDASTVEPTTT